MISKLPDALISQILLYLPKKEAVRTSVLSNRWKSLWLLIPGLDLASSQFPNYNAFVSFMDRFLGLSREKKSCLHKLKLSIKKSESHESCVTRWVDFVATPKLMHLDVMCLLVKRVCLEVMPLSLFICETLLHLRLHQISLSSFESVSLPRLKTMCLEHNIYANESCMESLISSCPVLEDLSIVRGVDDNVEVLQVRSQTLISLNVGFCVISSDSHRGNKKKGILIDAPRLKYLNFKYERSKSITICNLGFLDKVDLAGFFTIQDPSDQGLGLSKNQMARKFLTCISRVRDMIISDMTVEFFSSYMKVEPLPLFCKPSSLEATFCASDLNILPMFLESCLNLKSIVLHLSSYAKLMTEISFLTVPQCFLSPLEFVEITSKFMGRPVEIEVAKFFVQNSALLEKLVVHLSFYMRKESMGVLKDLLAFRAGPEFG